MKLSPEIEKLLLPSARIPNYVPDEYDVDISMIVKDWRESPTPAVGILGIPFDTACMSRRGARWGPQGVRNGLVAMTSYEPGLDVDISEGLEVADFGDVDVVHTSVEETHRRVTLVAEELCRKQIIPLSIGGDHSLTFPLVRGLCGATRGNVGVVYFDAHPDVRLARHGEVSSGTSFRRIFDELPSKQIAPRNVVAIGINGWHNSKRWVDYMKDIGMRVITAREVHTRGINAVMEDALTCATKDVDAIYVSVDIDCLDAAFAPGTNVPGQGGLTSFQLLEGVFALGRSPLVRGFDVMEVAPPLDSSNVTSYMGAAVLMQFLGALKARARDKSETEKGNTGNRKGGRP